MIKFSPLVPRKIKSRGKGQQHWSLLARREGRKAPTKACLRVTINSNLAICPLLSYCRDVEALANLTEALVLIDPYTASLFIYIYMYTCMHVYVYPTKPRTSSSDFLENHIWELGRASGRLVHLGACRAAVAGLLLEGLRLRRGGIQ